MEGCTYPHQGVIREHPYETGFYLLNGLVIFVPAIVTSPVLSAVGFTEGGVTAGK